MVLMSLLARFFAKSAQNAIQWGIVLLRICHEYGVESPRRDLEARILSCIRNDADVLNV